MGQRRHDTQRLGACVENRAQTCTAFFVLLFAQRPRLVLHDVLIYCRHQAPGCFEGSRKLVLIKEHVAFTDRLAGQIGNCIIGWTPGGCVRGIRHLAAKIARDHGQGPAGKVTEPVCQVGVITLY